MYGYLVFFFVSLSALATSAIASEEEKKLSDIKVKIYSKKQQINQLQVQEEDVALLLAQVNTQIDREKHSLRKIKHNITLLKQGLKQTSLDINQQQSAILSQTGKLKKQLNAAYIMGNSSPLKLLLRQEKADRLSRMAVYYDYFNQWRLSQLAALQKKLMALNSLKQHQNKQEQNLNTAQIEQQTNKASLDGLQQERKVLLAEIKQEVVSEKTNLAKLEADEQRLVRLVNAVKKKERLAKDELNFPQDEFKELRGKLPWPLPTDHVQLGNNKVAKHMGGVLIKASEGDEIRTVARGEVMYADWLRGYGLLMIINHGNDYLTLYAFNQTLLKQKGQKVVPGEVIARVGSSGGKYVSRLYFSIRKGSKPEDPYVWLLH